MIDQRCIHADVNAAALSSQAEVSGSSWVTGERTRIGPGAVVRNSRLHNAVIEAGAVVLDSIVIQDGRGHSHKCDAAGRTVVTSADQPLAGPNAHVSGCTLLNTAIGARSVAVDSWIRDGRIGSDCLVKDAKVIITNTDHHVTITGPTEVSEAWLGHHTTIDRRGYLEGIFGNAFRQLRCDEAGRLHVVGTIDLPHVSRYGINTINSTNSGKIVPQDGKPIVSFGPQSGLWGGEPYLNHEQIELAPCCLVVPWTKVVGQSPLPHHSDEELVNDELTTYLMPFAVAGWQGDLTRGLVMPGELSVGFGPKQRRGGWLFTYAPDAVFAMVERLHAALDGPRKAIADTIVPAAIETAIEMTKAMAIRNKVDLAVAHDKQKMGYPKWIGLTHALLCAHRDSGLWEFRAGRPVGWSKVDGRWTNPKLSAVLAIAPDALENQVSMQQLFGFDDPVMAAHVAMPSGGVGGTDGPAEIDPAAKVAPDAFVGPGCRIGKDVVIEGGARVWNSVLEACRVDRNASVARSVIRGSRVGADAVVRSCRVIGSELGARTKADGGNVVNSRLADETIVSYFADCVDTTANFGTILGGTVHGANIDVCLMSMHMAGGCRHLIAQPMPVELDGKSVLVPAIPMLGGGSLIRGTPDRPVVMQCAFVGSNAIIHEGTYLGFGCFVLGQLGPGAGLLPFTMSTDNDPRHHQLGGVLTSLASTVITHFIPWTYVAVGPELAPAVGKMVGSAIQDAIDALEYEIARRASSVSVGAGAAGIQASTTGGEKAGPADVIAGLAGSSRSEGSADGTAARFAKYTSLPLYEDSQLAAGLETFRRWQASGAWEMTFAGGTLSFASARGQWLERGGSAMWKPQR